MASKGKKTPKIDPAYQAALDAERGLVQQQLSDGERVQLSKLSPETAEVMLGTAPTTLCTEHVPNEENPLVCAKCGKPMVRASDWLKELEDEARQSELRFDEPDVTVSFSEPPAKDDGPIHESASVGLFTIAIEVPWFERLEKLAKRADMSPAKFVEDLIKRQWIASGAGKGKP